MMLQYAMNRPGPKSKKFAPFDAETFCRLCFGRKQSCGLFSLTAELREILEEMFNVEVDDNNNWKVCISCLKSVDKAVKFKETVKESDRRIKALLTKPVQKVRPNIVSDIVSPEESSEDDDDNKNKVERDARNESIVMADITKETVGAGLNANGSVEILYYEIPDPEVTLSCNESDFEPNFLGFDEDEINQINLHQIPAPLSPRSSLFVKSSQPSFNSPPEKKLKCEICKEMFHSYNELVVHRSTHKRSAYKNKTEQTSQCSYCKKVFKDRKCLTLHVMEHEKQLKSTKQVYRVQYCQMCYKKFGSSKALRVHLQQKHQNDSLAKNVCGVCMETFDTSTAVYWHKKSKHPEIFLR